MCISGVHLTHQLNLQCDAELQKLYMHSQGPTNSKDTLDLSVKSIIEKTVKGFEIDILTLETCVACIYNELNRDILDLSVKSIIKKTVKGLKIDFLTL